MWWHNEAGSKLSVSLRVVDLFCGAGGLSEGFRQAGFTVVAGVDSDPDACATYRLNFPNASVVCGDLRIPRVEAELYDCATEIDVVIGGPPCQAYSQVRNHDRLIDDPRNSLYRQFVKVVERLRPSAFVMENVRGMEIMGVKAQIIDDLSLGGEYVVVDQLLDAADFEVPQTRKRLFFIGVQKSLRLKPPELAGTGATRNISLFRRNGTEPVNYVVINRRETEFDICPKDTHDTQISNPESNRRYISSAEAIGDLSFLRAGSLEDSLPVDVLPEPKSDYQKLMRLDLHGMIRNVSVPRIRDSTLGRLRKIPQGGNLRELPKSTSLNSDPVNSPDTLKALKRMHSYAYRRLHPDFWSWTINTKGDCVYHYSEARALSVRELARLQSFPDRFVFITALNDDGSPTRSAGGPTHSRYRQVGNAVPPMLSRAVAKRLEETLATVSGSR